MLLKKILDSETGNAFYRRMSKSSLSLTLAFCILLGGCATTGVQPVNPQVVAKISSIPKTMAMVVIYRESNFYGRALRPTVVLNGNDLVNVGNGRVFVGAIPPGHYVFEMDDRKSGTEVDLKPGQAVYMKVELVQGFWKGGGRLLQVAPEQGAFEAKRLEPVDSREIENPAFR